MSDAESNAAPTPASVYDHIVMMLEQMTAVSWQKLGLQPDTMTGRIESNLAEARVAIDLAGHLSSLLEPQLDEEDKRRVQGMVRDLRVNFVQKNKEVQG